jgi:methylmalonyl-CoA mutase N-terminal domain/subunit
MEVNLKGLGLRGHMQKGEIGELKERKGSFKNLSGMVIDPVYGPEDIAKIDWATEISSPGFYPFTRGIHKNMYRGRLWTIRQLGSLGPPDEANERIRHLIEMGATGVSICFDLPTIMGRDSDDPLCRGEVGRCGGVAIDTVEDMAKLLNGIPLEEISINFVSNAQSSVILAMFIVVAEERGIHINRLRGTLQNDILKEYQAQKSFYFPPRPSMRLTIDVIRFCTERMPLFNPISISGYHLASAGATPLQELAFTLANAFTYVEEGMKSGLHVDSFAPRLSFFFKAHNDFFENIAKYRAARRIWSKTMREKYGARDPKSWMFRVHTQTSGSSLIAQEPENNIIRTAFQALSAVLAGTQSLHTNSYDEAFSIPAPRAERLALRTQQIIAHETGVTDTVDPLGGSYYVEALTKRMEEGCNEYFRKIEDLGGVISAIEKGFFQREIAESAIRYQKEIERGERIIVGLNAFKGESYEKIKEFRKVDMGFEKRKVEALREFKERRDQSLLKKSLEEIRNAILKPDGEIMPSIINAVRNRATLGEIIGEMRGIFGDYEEEAIL